MKDIDKIPEGFYAPEKNRHPKLKAWIEHDRKYVLYRPLVPGEPIEYIYMPAMGFMTGRLLKKGQVIRIIDLEGQQIPDVVIWDANNLANVLSGVRTQYLNHKWTKWRPGDVLYSKYCSRLATITEDTTDGTHAANSGMCAERLNYARYGVEGTPNCHDNLVSAMTRYNLTSKDIDPGNVFGLFMDPGYTPDGGFDVGEPHNKPGDYTDIMADMDIIIAISNCPGIRNPCNAYEATSLMAVVFKPDNDYQAKSAALPQPDALPVD